MIYNRDDSGNEYYALPVYAKTKDLDEIYATKANGDQFYLAKPDGTEIMAKKHDDKGNLVFYFAMTRNQIPICPILVKNQQSLKENIPYFKNSRNKEIYPKRKNRECYIDNENEMIYAKNEYGEEYYATDNNKKYYASRKLPNGDVVQYPIVDKKGKKKYIEENGIYIYPINITKNIPIYPEDEDKNEIYLEKNKKQFYGFNVQKLPVYAKHKTKNDYFALDNNVPYYSFYEQNGDKFQYYPKMKNKREFYLKMGNKEIYAKFKLTERYAKTENLKDEILATDNAIPYYATNENSIEVYPKTTDNQFYRVENSIEKVAMDKKNNVGFYAKTKDQNEFYPKDFNETPVKEDTEILEPMFYIEPTSNEIITHMSSFRD